MKELEIKDKDVKQFDIVLCDCGEVQFAGEQGGIRPALVVQNDTGNYYSGTTIVLPFTTQKRNLSQPTHVLFKKDLSKGLIKDSILLAECVRQVAKNRIIKYLGKVTDEIDKKKIEKAYYANIKFN